jgi:hypothetical protein
MEYGVPVVLCRSRLLFTSLNRAAEGLRLQSITEHHVDSLSDDAAQKVLLADGIELEPQKLLQALKFCGGLPLALTLLHGALHGVQRAGCDADSILQRLEATGNISCDKKDRLWEALSFSVECLSEELKIIWLDLVQLFQHKRFAHIHGFIDLPLLKLQCLFGDHHLRDLELRNLVIIKEAVEWDVQEPYVEVVVHDVLLCMADHMCGPDSDDYHYMASCVEHSGNLPVPLIKVRIPCFIMLMPWHTPCVHTCTCVHQTFLEACTQRHAFYNKHLWRFCLNWHHQQTCIAVYAADTMLSLGLCQLAA